MDIIGEKKITKFIDDSCSHIKDLYKKKKKQASYPLKKLIWSYPEGKKYYNVPLDLELSICIKGWKSTSKMIAIDI